MSRTQELQAAPGARLVVRDAEWLVRRVDKTSTGGKQFTCVGISQLVKDKEAIFLNEIERIEVMKPELTEPVNDTSGSFSASLLYIESMLRRTAPTDESLYLGHLAAMDLVPYQLDPALQALKQPRQRILIADAVGLGKTLEAGILVSELMKRGKGKRILVVAVKSMLTQFQKEFWCRFTIPLTRLDSIGIQRIRHRIPTNHNPFYYYDKSIISIDTLKQDSEYRVHIEKAYWDIIIIDEAHNAADRGSGALRNKLARLLAKRSDTLILLSATPHDGRARSFASLMNMLDPTAIANPDSYSKEDIKGLFIRRFKKDIQDQVKHAFQERHISKVRVNASDMEEQVFELFAKLEFSAIDQRKTSRGYGAALFKTTLEKALFSSPAACIETIDHRLQRLHGDSDDSDRQSLLALKEKLEQVTPHHFSKYRELLRVIRDKKNGLGWNAKDPADRLVIFTERLETLRFLETNLMADLGLKEKQIETLTGDMPDIDQQCVVEAFAIESSPLRLLLASDVASEGINLHFLCFRMIHFDIPWSLMVFQQRNGRIDRYGQKRKPEIVYLVTDCRNEKIKGDSRILEVLIEKDEQAAKNIGDPSVFMGVYDIQAEEQITAQAIETGHNARQFEESLEKDADDEDDLWALIMGREQPPKGEEVEKFIKDRPSIFQDDYAFLKAGLRFYQQAEPLQVEFDDEKKIVHITMNKELKQRFRQLPREVMPGDNDNVFSLAADKKLIQQEIARARKQEIAWPRIHFLWELNPVLEWISDKVTAAFGRRQAPVLILPGVLEKGETIFVVSSLIPNQKSHPLLHYWNGVSFINGTFKQIEPFSSVIERTGLGKQCFPNPGSTEVPQPVKDLLPAAVEKIRAWMSEKWKEFEAVINDKLNLHLQELERLKANQFRQLELYFSENATPSSLAISRKAQKEREIEAIFDEYIEWIEDTMTTEDNPYIQVAAVLVGEG